MLTFFLYFKRKLCLNCSNRKRIFFSLKSSLHENIKSCVLIRQSRLSCVCVTFYFRHYESLNRICPFLDQLLMTLFIYDFFSRPTVPPTQVTIAGPTEARQGDVINFQCSTAPSNPAAEIRWTIDGRQRRTNVSAQVPSNEGGWISTSNISINVDSNKRSYSLLCQGINMQLADNVMTTHMLHILCKRLECPIAREMR